MKDVVIPFVAGNITLDNVTLWCVFFNGKQNTSLGNQTLTVFGGRVEFQINFNFTIVGNGTNQTGNAYGKQLFTQPR